MLIPTRSLCRWCLLAAALLGVCLLLFQPMPAQAASFVVTTAVDENDNSCTDGDCSLRDAIGAAVNGDTITFAGDTTIYLTSQINLTETLTIDGGGYAVTLSGDTGNDGSANVRVFNIAAGKTVILNHLRLVKGAADMGGAIYNAGTLTLQDCTLADNTANSGSNGGGAIWNESGTLNLTRTTLANNTAGFNGGGLLNRYGTVTLQTSTLSGNRALNGRGGGINSINGSIILRNSTFSGNSALVNGGGADNGGGIYHWGVTLALYNTIIANSAGGDCTLVGGGTITTNSYNLVESGACANNGVGFLSGDPNLGVLSDNGGLTQTHALLPGSKAIEAGSNANCLDADQRGTARPQMSRCDIGAYEILPLPILQLSNSVSPAGTVAYAGGVVTYTLVVTNVSTLNDPLVLLTDTLPAGMNFTQWVVNPGALADGGQVTWSGPLASQSSLKLVFRAAHVYGLELVNTLVISDSIQKLQAAVTLNAACQTSLAVTSANDAGAGSLRQAVSDSCAGGVISFANDVTIHLNSEVAIGKNLTIDGSGHSVTLSGDSGNDGSANVRVLNISAGRTVTLDHLTITKAYHSDRGAGIYNAGTLTVLDSTLSANSAGFGGAAIYNYSGALSVYTSTLTGNSGAYGGAVNSYNGTVLIQNCLFSGNSASSGGGALYYYKLFSGSITVKNSKIANNSSGYGGGLEVRNAPLVLQNILLENNTATYNGGGLYYNSDGYAGSDDIVTIENSTLVSNTASTVYDAYAKGGGAIFQYRGSLIIRSSTLSANAAQQSEGGGIVTWGWTTLLNSTLLNNTSRGATYESGLAGYADLNMQNTLIAGGNGPDCGVLGMVTITNVNNLVEDGTCSANGVNFISGAPHLAPLADNGGLLIGPGKDFATPTHALLAASPAIDAGEPASCLPLDQRGQALTDFNCDIGAFELTDDLASVQRTVSTTTLTTFGPSLVSIRNDGGADPGLVTVTKSFTWYTKPDNTINPYWKITAANPRSLNLTLRLCYRTGERNGISESALRFWRSSAGVWTRIGPDSPLTWTTVSGRRCASLSGITDLSAWTLGNRTEPLASGLKSFSARAGGRPGGIGAWFGLAAVIFGLGWGSWRLRPR